MNVTTLPGSRQQRAQQHAPRSGGLTTGRADTTATQAPQTHGATALQPQREVSAPKRGSGAKPPTLKVAPPAPVSAPRAPFVALVLVLVIAGVIGILVLNTKIAENAFRLAALKDQQGALDRDEQQLRSDLADKESPARLAARATQLGLVPSRTPSFLLLPNGTRLEMPGPGNGK